MPNIFNYTDYRKFLHDFYTEEKSRKPFLSYRYIAGKVGFKSAGHFTQIIKGKVNLSPEMMSRFIDFLKLKRRAAEYFELMVYYNQAKSHDEKKRHFERMTSFKEVRARIIDPAQYEYYNKWYYLAVRELVAIKQFRNEYTEMGRMLDPAVSATEVKKALVLLERLGLIRRNEQKVFEQVDALLSMRSEGSSVAVTNQAIQTMQLGREAIDRFPREQRNISGVSFSISTETFDRVQEEVRAFRKRILQLARDDANPEAVYQFNVQLFPLSKPVGKKGA